MIDEYLLWNTTRKPKSAFQNPTLQTVYSAPSRRNHHDVYFVLQESIIISETVYDGNFCWSVLGKCCHFFEIRLWELYKAPLAERSRKRFSGLQKTPDYGFCLNCHHSYKNGRYLTLKTYQFMKAVNRVSHTLVTANMFLIKSRMTDFELEWTWAYEAPLQCSFCCLKGTA